MYQYLHVCVCVLVSIHLCLVMHVCVRICIYVTVFFSSGRFAERGRESNACNNHSTFDADKSNSRRKRDILWEMRVFT